MTVNRQLAIGFGIIAVLVPVGVCVGVLTSWWVVGAVGLPILALLVNFFPPGRVLFIVLSVALMTVVMPETGALGIRCSVNSAYLHERFDTADQRGCVVLRVSGGAAEAGIEIGDLLVEMDGYPVTSGQQFSTQFGQSAPPWQLTVIREGRELTFDVESRPGSEFEEDPDDALFYYLRGRQYQLERPEEALEDYSRAIELEPGFDLAYLYRGVILERMDDYSEARADYSKAIDLSPELGEAHHFYAFLRVDRSISEARAHINTAYALDECAGSFEGFNFDCAASSVLLAYLAPRTEPETQLEIALQGIEFYPGVSGNYFYAMCAYARLGDEEAFRRYGEWFLELAEEDPDANLIEFANDMLYGNRSYCPSAEGL